jgi:hypothetical protein
LKTIAKTLWTEPVVFLGVLVGASVLLAKEGLIAGWIPLLVLAIAAPIQRELVTPETKLKRLSAAVRKELDI